MRPLLSVGFLVVLLLQPALGQTTLRLVRAIELRKAEGRIDHLALDTSEQRLFVAALGNNTVEVIDLRTGTDVKSLAGFHEPQGIAVIPEQHAVAVANGRSGNLQLFDARDFRLLQTVPLSEDADNVRYDPIARRVYVAHGSGAIAAVDPVDGRVVAEVRLAGHPESFQLEKAGSRIFANIPDAGHIAVIDRTTMRVTTTWALTGARGNYPMALDEQQHRLFIGCRQPAKVLVYDTSSGRQVASFEIDGDADDLFCDPARRCLYVSCGEGFLDVFQQRDADHFTRSARVPTAAGARTSLYVPPEKQLYLAVPHRGDQKAEIRIYRVEH